MVEPYLEIDLAKGIAEFQGHDVDVAVPVIKHIETGAIVWQAPVVVPLILDDWLERAVAQHSTLRVDMREYWPEVEVHTNWWMIEPGDEDYPHGLRA